MGRVTARQRHQRWIAAGLSGLLLLAVATRFYHLAQLPPGLWYDEAWASVQARDLGANGSWPVYFDADFGGLHPAIIYLTWLARQVSHDSPWAIRYAAAGASILSLPLTFLALRAIFELDSVAKQRADWQALAGTAALTLSFPTLVFARIGFEVYLLAAAAAGVFYSLAAGLRRRRAAYFVLAGLGLGVGLYCYHAARFLPMAVTLALAGVAWQTRQWRWHTARWALMALGAAVVFFPLGRYLWQHSDILLARAQVASYNTLGPGADSVPLALLRNVGRTAAGIGLPGFGDGLLRHNLPGRPIYGPFLALLFGIGIIYLIRRWRQPGMWLLATWGSVMMLPVVLSDGAPTYTRMWGAMPAFAGIIAAGIGGLVDWLPRRRQRWLAAGLAAGFLMTLAANLYSYFGVWANEPGLFDAFQVGEWQAAERARNTEGVVYLTPDRVNTAHPTFDLLLRDSSVRAFNSGDCLILADASPQPVTYVVDLRADAGIMAQLAALYPTGYADAPIRHQPSGDPLYAIFVIPPGGLLAQPLPLTESRFDAIRLRGYEWFPAEPEPGDTLLVTLYWQATQPMPADYTPFVHLYAAGEENQQPAAQHDAPPCAGRYGTSRWRSGEIIANQHRLTLPAVSGQTYVIAVGWYAWPSLVRLPLATNGPTLPDDRLPLTSISLND